MDTTRRNFLKNSVLTASVLGIVPSVTGKDLFSMGVTTAGSAPFVGIQIAAQSFYDEGMDYCLDLLQEYGSINNIMVSFHALYGAIGRPQHLMGDHGVPKPDNTKRTLRRNWIEHHEKYYNKTRLKPMPPEKNVMYADKDFMNEILEAAHKRGITVHERLYELHGTGINNYISNFDSTFEIAFDGTKRNSSCANHPEYREWIKATMRDMFESYALDGIQFGSETNDPLWNIIERGVKPGCFCSYCKNRIAEKGYDPDKALAGVTKLYNYITELKASKNRPPDGAYTIFWRLMMQYPEILVWSGEWQKGRTEIQKLIYDTVKASNQKALVGRHITGSQNAKNVFFRAGTAPEDLAIGCDYLKPIVYHEIMGPRVEENYLDAMHNTLFKGMPKELILDFYYELYGYDRKQQPNFENLTKTGLSPNYVFVETKRLVEGMNGKVSVYPGIGIDIPKGKLWGDERWISNPKWLEEAVLKAFEAGASGVVACREYEEMTLSSLKAFGDGVRVFS